MSKILDKCWNLWVPEPNTGCYIWVGTATGGAQRNRPMVSVNGKMKKVARLVCEEIYGPIGALVAAHKPNIGCIGAMCVNPEHTYPATVQQNCMDKPSELRIKMASIGGKANGGWNKGMKMYRGKYR